MYKTISKISISSELFQVEPLQYYVCRLAEYCKVPDNKMLSLQILVEEEQVIAEVEIGFPGIMT